MSYRNRTGIWIDFDFEHKGKSEQFSYEIPDARVVCDGIRHMFEQRDVIVDAKDSDLVNACYEFGIDFEENADFQDYVKKACEADAKEEFEDYKKFDDDEE